MISLLMNLLIGCVRMVSETFHAMFLTFFVNIVSLVIVHYRSMMKADDLAFIASHTLTKQ